jgi:hypothetical protein
MVIVVTSNKIRVLWFTQGLGFAQTAESITIAKNDNTKYEQEHQHIHENLCQTSD